MDQAALVQVIANLLVNCERHAPGAQVWLRARSADGRVRIEVADDGPGLPPGAAEDLLRRGARGPGSTGSGLGLAITADIVGQHQGTLTLASGGRGCSAVIDLPAERLGAPTADCVGA
nr:ATP-binding protein [Pseudonocardia acidicola]